MKIYKRYDELDFTDDFMFCKVLTDNPDLARELAELVTGRKIRSISVPKDQVAIKNYYDGKGVRFDVCFDDDANTVYDIEMQTTKKKNLPKRTRYYQSMSDERRLKTGQDYDELANSYIIFICLEDPFDRNFYKYTFENRCVEDVDLRLDDGAMKIFLNASGTSGKASKDVREFLRYLKDRTSGNEFTDSIESAIKTAIDDREGRKFYMTLLEKYQEERSEGFFEGCIKGRLEGSNQMIYRLVQKGKLSLGEGAEELNISEAALKNNMILSGYKWQES